MGRPWEEAIVEDRARVVRAWPSMDAWVYIIHAAGNRSARSEVTRLEGGVPGTEYETSLTMDDLRRAVRSLSALSQEDTHHTEYETAVAWFREHPTAINAAAVQEAARRWFASLNETPAESFARRFNGRWTRAEIDAVTFSPSDIAGFELG